MTKRYLMSWLVGFITLFVGYLIASFVAASFDISTWDQEGRMGGVLLVGTIAFIMAMMYYIYAPMSASEKPLRHPYDREY